MGFTVASSRCLFKYDLCLSYGGTQVKVADADYKKKGRVCGGEDWNVSRMHNKHRVMERVGGREWKRETTPPMCNPTHAYRGYEGSSRWLQIPPHDDRRKVETLEYHHLSQQWCRPQAGFMPLSPIRYCKWCTLVPRVLALQQTVSLGLLHKNSPTTDDWFLIWKAMWLLF